MSVNQQQKILFFDIDGTLVNRHGEMPDSARKSLKQAQQNGCKILLCSGRGIHQIYPWLLDMGFDGVISSTGSRVEYEGRVIYNHSWSPEILDKFCKVMDGVNYGLVSGENLVMKPQSITNLEKFLNSDWIDKALFESIFGHLVPDEHPERLTNVEKSLYYRAPFSTSYLQEKLGDVYEVQGSSFDAEDGSSGEVLERGINKSMGLKQLLHCLGLTAQNAVAFGDGANDLDMIEFAGTGVAMGNGIPAIKDAADLVTDDLDDDGIAKALKALKLID